MKALYCGVLGALVAIAGVMQAQSPPGIAKGSSVRGAWFTSSRPERMANQALALSRKACCSTRATGMFQCS